jgi:glucose/arabinose dehydrogenase
VGRTGAIILTLVLTAAMAAPANAAVTLEPIGDFSSPVFVASEPNDPDRILVVEKEGRIMASKHGVVTTYLDIRGMVADDGERGLLSVALSPDYASTGLLYVFYTRSDPDPLRNGDLQIDEFRAESGSVSVSTRRPVLTIDHEQRSNHNGGQLQFGPDGFLYLATGDGAANAATAQDTGTLLGKVLRIWPHPAPGVQYTIPSSNPFHGATPGADEVWSYGLRNPWRFSFDRLTGDLVIADVGAGTFEEIDFEPAPDGGRGDNFGWPRCEGFNLMGSTSAPCDLPGATPPAYAYQQGPAGECAITGGYVVRDTSLGDLYGRYLFADLCTGQVSSAQLALPTASDVRAEPLTVSQPSSFGEDSCGRLYLAALGSDEVYRLVGDGPASCVPQFPGPGDVPPGPGPGDSPHASCGGETVTHATPATGGVLKGTPGKDVIVGSDEADRILGRGGADLICGVGRGDTLKGGGGADELRGGAGADTLRGGGGDDRCKGGPGRDEITSC